MSGVLSVDLVASRIFSFRGRKVMIDVDLAILYGVSTKRLNEQVKRNRNRFPDDFMFRLTRKEKEELVANCDRFNTLKHSTVFPYVFTEQGVAMLSSVLNSEQAVAVNIQIMRAFVIMRRTGLTYAGLKRKIEEMEQKYDKQFLVVFEAFKKLLDPPPEPKKPPIGFRRD